MKKSEVVTILGSQSYKCENYNSHIVSWSPPEDSSTLIYTTVNSNEIIRITNKWEYFEYIYDDKGRDLLSNKKSNTSALDVIFKDPGRHKIYVKFIPLQTNLSGCFYGCFNLYKVSEDLFKGCSNVINIINIFRNCQLLSEIPKELFIYFPNLKYIEGCFAGCDSLTYIPEKLFINNNKITSFEECWYMCSNLKTIPEDLFQYTPEVETVRYCFCYCYNLSQISNNLFDNCFKIANFGSCFKQCNILITPSGINNIELWKRTSYDEFPRIINGIHCFENCSSIPNYYDIPEEWR